ncbi:hypothetical protein AB1Y20_012326 [Prymnesium parvum]|uniref:Uncharacterized protein n=1 Tax=Prymnesium parvum TaxID=97485 RepID=A0AB34INT0_PRYPA
MSACSQLTVGSPHRRHVRTTRPASAYERSSSALTAIVPMSLHSGQRTHASVEQTKLSTRADARGPKGFRARASIASLANASPQPRLRRNALRGRALHLRSLQRVRALPHALLLALGASWRTALGASFFVCSQTARMQLERHPAGQPEAGRFRHRFVL